MVQVSNALLVALCATDATAIETIAITLICYHIMPSSSSHQLFTSHFEFNGREF